MASCQCESLSLLDGVTSAGRKGKGSRKASDGCENIVRGAETRFRIRNIGLEREREGTIFSQLVNRHFVLASPLPGCRTCTGMRMRS